MTSIQTSVSPFLKSDGAHICHPGGGGIYWLDELFGGALHKPDGFLKDMPMVILISGPPGSGKSLLAQQICYSRVLQSVKQWPRNDEMWPRMLYLSTESPSDAIAANMQALGWNKEYKGQQLFKSESYKVDPSKPRDPLSFTYSTKPCPNYPPLKIFSPLSHDIFNSVEKFVEAVKSGWRPVGESNYPAEPDLLVIDSLNVFLPQIQRTKIRDKDIPSQNGQREKETEFEQQAISVLYERLVGIEPKPQFLFLLLDSVGVGVNSDATRHQFWEYIADVIIKLEYVQNESEYFARHIEIVKTRFQSHVLGKQLIKIFPKIDTKKDLNCKLDIDPEGSRPYINQGGVFIFPSEHYILSQIRTGKPLFQLSRKWPNIKLTVVENWDKAKGGFYKPAPWGPGDIAVPQGINLHPKNKIDWEGESSKNVKYFNWPIGWCYELAGGSGIPVGHTIAIIGHRGLHKNHFGYQFILDGICNNEHTLIISFRDNHTAVNRNLKWLAQVTEYTDKVDIEKLENRNMVLYQRPGYVSPEEFLHRVMAAIAEHAPTRVMVTAIDQWRSSYPLLAKSDILVPTLVDFLNTHQVTSMVIGVPQTNSDDIVGLTSKAEIVLTLEHRNIDWAQDHESPETRQSLGYAIDGFPLGCFLRTPAKRLSKKHSKVIINAVRVSQGGAGLARAVLEYQYSERKTAVGLRLVPLAPEYPIGDLV